MNTRRWLSPSIVLLLAFVGLSVLLVAVLAAPAATVSGVVVDLGGEPVAGAVVRRQTTTEATASDADGSFVLAGLPEGTPITVTAWQEDYLVGWAVVVAPQAGVTITLKPHYTGDDPFYEWFSSNDPDDPISCVHCMVAHPQWQDNAHGNAGINPRFFSLYNGTDLTGTTTITPGYKLDFPGTAGNCATCHAPAAAVRGQRTFAAADMNDLQGVEAEGVFCEFCHKAGGVYLNPATGLPYNNAPGVLSMRLYRPASGGAEQLFFGPFDDVTRRVSYLELEKKSQFCAPCHQFSFWGTPIYESFREWLESPYPAQGIECQTCHMRPTGVDYFVFPDQGGLIRDPELIASHLQPGAADEELLQNTVTMTVVAQQVAGAVEVTVTITNTEAGHHVPTDHPGRHMILTVTATDGQRQPLAQQDGPIVPEWGGAQAGLPGNAFAKVLRDVQTGEAPVVSYWKQVLIADDNRIPAMGSDISVYAFAAPAVGGPVTVTAELRFRRTFQAVMEAKGWDEPDVVMEKAQTVAQAPTAAAVATHPAVAWPAAPSTTDKWALWTGPTHLRGANIYQRRVYPELDGPEFMGPGPVGPPYTQQDFDRLAAMGANYVNISHPGLFAETPPFALDRDIQDNLDNLLSMIAQANMFAVISFRTGPRRAEFSVCCLGDDWFPESYLNDTVWEDQAAQDAWVEMWRYTAERYRDNPIVAGYDLMVEPNANEVLIGEWLDPEEFYAQYGGTLADWNQLYPRITAAIRQVDSLTPILIGGMGYSGVEWLSYLEPTNDPRTVYVVHQYAPYLYTHQWWDSLDCIYPGFCDVDWDGEYDDWLDRAWLDDLLSTVDDFAAAHNVPVAVNEFGIIRWVPGAAEFMDDQMDLFEQRGMNHALWLWETSWPPIQDEIDAFNFRHGPDPQNHDDVPSSDLMDVILDYWGCNTIRPSSTLTKTTVFLPGVLTLVGAKVAPLPLDEITYWAYQIQDLNASKAVDTLVASHYDMLVLEPTRTDWSSDDKYFDTKGMVARLKNSQASDGVHRKLVLAYVDIGEAEDWRWYWTWSQDWDCQGAPPADWPDYILTCDPDGWAGNYPVAYWDEDWKDIIIYGENTGSHPDRDYYSVIDEAIRDGFDGIYLDWVEAFDNTDVITAAQEASLDPAMEMIAFIQEMRDYAAIRNPDFLIIQQNAASLIDGHPELVNVIDAISQEAIWYDGDADVDWNDPDGYDWENDQDLVDYYLGHLAEYVDAGLPIFDCEYALSYAGNAYANSHAKGFVPYVTRRSLSQLTTTPPPGY